MTKAVIEDPNRTGEVTVVLVNSYGYYQWRKDKSGGPYLLSVFSSEELAREHLERLRRVVRYYDDADAMPDGLKDIRLLSSDEVCRMLRATPRTLLRWRTNKAMQFPTAVVIEGRTRYVEGEIRAWIESRRQIA